MPYLDFVQVIRPAMFTISCHVNSVEGIFDLALELKLSFKGISISKVMMQCPRYSGYGDYDYQCSLKGQYIVIVSTDNVGDLRVVENAYVREESTSDAKDTLVDSNIMHYR